jgi:hypothetical protein
MYKLYIETNNSIIKNTLKDFVYSKNNILNVIIGQNDKL